MLRRSPSRWFRSSDIFMHCDTIVLSDASCAGLIARQWLFDVMRRGGAVASALVR